ncbi:MAG: hypothetical protein JNM31_11115 [Flavobacteriales bacterium]|nr:hypothetical protein [Flavobacteriales bacterium]
MAEQQLRVGILCDGLVFQRWQADAILDVIQVPGVVPVGLLVNGAPARPVRSLHSLLYRQYRRRLFKPKAMELVDLTAALGDWPKLVCTPAVSGPVHRFSEADITRVHQLRPDVLLRFGFNILRGPILDLPTHGVWSFHHGDEEKYRGGPPGFWEIMDGDPVTGAILQRLTEKLDAGRILQKGWFRTVDHSLEETVDTVLTASSGWPAKVCRAILRGEERAASGVESTTHAPIRRYPGNFTFLRFIRKQAKNKLQFHRQQLNAHEEWNIGILPQPIQTLLKEEHSLNVRWLPPPAVGTYRADPFGYLGPDGQLNVLYEKYDYTTGTGAIHRVRPKADNILKRSRCMLGGDDAHRSYPYTFEHEGQIYCVPESAATGRVTLHRVNATNDALEEVADLLDEPLYDPTLFLHEGHWWLFGTRAPWTNVTLEAYHAPALLGPYAPHLLNPIKQDIRNARPAGTPFLHEGALYRPAMDCARTYGGRVVINRILALDPFTFQESAVKHIGPIKGLYGEGLHTLSAVGGLTLLDGKRTVLAKAQRVRVQKRMKDRVTGGDKRKANT